MRLTWLKFEAEAEVSGEPQKPQIGRLIFKMGFKQPKNPITLIGLVLPRLAFTMKVGQNNKAEVTENATMTLSYSCDIHLLPGNLIAPRAP